MLVISLVGIVLSLVLLITLAYRGHSVLIAAPISALVAVLFSGAPLLATYTQIFMPAMGRFIVQFFPLFLIGAIFGALMSVTGLAGDLAKWITKLIGPEKGLLATVLATALLTYGGVSSWVIVFTIYPIAVALFKEAGIPKRLMPAAIALGVFTFATATLPGSPQIHNVIPTRYFDTTAFAAPVTGIIAAIITFSLGMLWLQYRAKKLRLAGEGYYSHLENHDGSQEPSDGLPQVSPGGLRVLWRKSEIMNVHTRGVIALIPVLVVVGVNAAFVALAPKLLDFSYLQEDKFGNVELPAVLGTWSVLAGLLAAVVLILIMVPQSFGQCVKEISEGAKRSVVPALTTASEVGYGAAIASLAVFAVITNGLFSISDNPLILGAIGTAVIAAITGSASGGLSISLETFAQHLIPLAQEQGISMDLMHRVMAMASVSFDSLPHNGAIVTLLLVTGMSHRQSYKDIGMVTIIPPAIGILVVIGLAAVFPGLV